jgi:hypothetical protein
VWGNHFQHIGGQVTGDAHFFDFFRCIDNDSHDVKAGSFRFSVVDYTAG